MCRGAGRSAFMRATPAVSFSSAGGASNSGDSTYSKDYQEQEGAQYENSEVRHFDSRWSPRDASRLQLYKIAKRSGKGSWRNACEVIIEESESAPGVLDEEMIPSRLRLIDDQGNLTLKPVYVCGKEPTLGDPSDGTKRRCAKHSRPTDVIMNLRSCEVEGCHKRAVYGSLEKGMPKRCGNHIQENDVRLLGLRCSVDGCTHPARYAVFRGKDGNRSEIEESYCSTHRVAGSKPIRVPKKAIGECIVPGCGKKAQYGPINENLDNVEGVHFRSGRRTLHCEEHRLAGHVCTTMLSWYRTGKMCTYEETDPLLFSERSKRAEIFATELGLPAGRCVEKAAYGDATDGKTRRCRKHKLPGYVNVTNNARRDWPVLHKHLIQLFDGPNDSSAKDFNIDFQAANAKRKEEDYSSTFTYIIVCMKSRECVIIDPVLEQVERDIAIIESLNLNPKYALNTHVHADHITGTTRLRERFTGMKTAISRASGAKADILLDPHNSLFWGPKNKGVAQGNRVLKCLPTPGHTEGCMSFYDPHVGPKGSVFTGDALLIGGCGRTDFQGGDSRTLYQSVHKELFALDDKAVVYPAHDYAGLKCSTIGAEKQTNPRLGQGRSKDEFVEFMSLRKMPYPRKIDVAVPANMECGVFAD